MNRKIILFPIYASLLFGMCSCTKDKKKERPPLSVQIKKVIKKDSPLYIYAVGNTESQNMIDIRSQVTGILLQAHVDEGLYLTKDQLIYTIDPAPYQAALDKAKAQLLESQASLKLAVDKVARNTPLMEQEFISELQYDELVTDVELGKARVDLDKAQIVEAEINLAYCYIKSPVTGKMSYNKFDPGNLIVANSDMEMTTVRQMDPIDLVFSISQKDFLKFQHQHEQGDTHFDFIVLDTDGTEMTRQGLVYFVDNNVSTDSGTILMKGAIKNSDFSLWPGEFGKVKLIVKIVKDALLMPSEALQAGEKGPYVFVLEKGDIVSTRNITVVEKVEDYLMVSAGLKEGDEVITEGQLNLKPGMKVIVKESDTPDSAVKKPDEKTPDLPEKQPDANPKSEQK